MAGEEERRGPEELREDPLVERLLPDPSQPPPELMKLIGFLGRDAEQGYWRVYFTTHLDNYVRVAEADIVASQPLESSRAEPARTEVLVKREAKLQHTRTVSRQTQAAFLQGDIASGFLEGTSTQLTRAPQALGLISLSLVTIATVTIAICEPETSDCPTEAGTSRTSCCLCDPSIP